MKSAAKNIQISSYEDLFKTEQERQADAQERVQNLPLEHLVPFPKHISFSGQLQQSYMYF